MANDSSGKSIADAYRDWPDDTMPASPASPPSAGAAIADAYRTMPDDSSTAALPARWRPYQLGIQPVDEFVEGVGHGVANALATGANVANWVDQRVPFLASLDRSTIGDPATAATKLDAFRRNYEASPESKTNAAAIGRVGGEIVATLPVMGPVAKGVGAGVNALARVAPDLPSIIPWAVRTATEGGAAGGAFGALTSGGSDQPVGDYIKDNALVGAALGPAASVVGKVAGFVGRGAQGTYNYLRGRAGDAEVERAMAEARARSGGATTGESAPVAPETAPAPEASAPPAAPPATATPGWRRMEPGEPLAPGQEVATAQDGGQWVRDTTAPSSGGPSPGMGGPQPQSGGAAATSAEDLAANAPTRRREIAGKVDALDKMISERPNIGTADFHEHVKGNFPTHAEGLGDAKLASIQRQVEPGDQGYTNFRNQAVENRLEHFERRSGTAEQLETKETDLKDWDRRTLGPVWARKQPVDASGVLTDVDARLASPEAQIGPVESALSDVRSRLFKRGTETLHDDPEMLYGARRHVSYMLSRAGRQANPAYGDADVMRELIGVRDALDRAIEPGAPGFNAWRKGHADASREIDRMDVLQSMRQKLIGGDGDIQLGRLNGALKGLRTQMARDGANPVHSLGLEDLEMLRDLNRDLLREGNKRLSMPIGSPTAHNLDVATEHGLHAVNALAQAAASKIPGAGYLLEGAAGTLARKNATRQKELWRRNLLAPPPAD